MKNALELYKNAGDANSSYYAGSMASANGLKTAATAQTGAQKALGNAYANINTQLPGQIAAYQGREYNPPQRIPTSISTARDGTTTEYFN